MIEAVVLHSPTQLYPFPMASRFLPLRFVHIFNRNFVWFDTVCFTEQGWKCSFWGGRFFFIKISLSHSCLMSLFPFFSLISLFSVSLCLYFSYTYLPFSSLFYIFSPFSLFFPVLCLLPFPALFFGSARPGFCYRRPCVFASSSLFKNLKYSRNSKRKMRNVTQPGGPRPRSSLFNFESMLNPALWEMKPAFPQLSAASRPLSYE